MEAEVKPAKPVVMEINDKTIVFKPAVDSKPADYLESSLTSMRKMDCASNALPCLANAFLEGNPEATTKQFNAKADSFVNTFLKQLEPSMDYKLEHCLLLRFHGSLLSAKKTEAARASGDNSTCSLICPFMLSYTTSMQLAFMNAFNRAM